MNIKDLIPGYNKLVLPYHLLRATISGFKYGWPGRRMTVIGVTGTNGKTSTSFMIWQMLNSAGYKTGIMTTVGWGVDKINPQIEHMTTESVNILNERMKKIADSGAEFLVLEVTSHALAQFRTLGVPIEVAVLTNVTHEHLDYHKTFENYRDAKRKLFKKARFGIINADDKSAAFFISSVLPKKYADKVDSKDTLMARPDRFARREREYYLTYGTDRGVLKASNIKTTSTGVSYSCGKDLDIVRSDHAVSNKDESSYTTRELHIKTQIPGTFTVYNSLAAVAVGLRLGLSESEIEKGIHSLTSVEGRMNRLSLGQNFEVIVDYAHTPDAIQKVFDSVKDHSGRIISVHGGAGRRDESTRAERGQILAKYSDIVIITEDDSRDEDPAEIASMFIDGCQAYHKTKPNSKPNKVEGENLFIELNRKKAIEKACKLAKKGDLVLILGKGHEKTILRKDGPHPFEDLKVTEKILKKLRS